MDTSYLLSNVIVACETGDAKTVAQYVEYCRRFPSRYSINARDFHDKTALMHASKSGYPEIVRILLRYVGHDVDDFGIRIVCDVNACDSEGITALSHVLRGDGRRNKPNEAKNRAEIVEMLVDFGANVNAIDEMNETPISLATGFGNFLSRGDDPSVVGRVFEKLIGLGANINFRNPHGATPLLSMMTKENFFATSGFRDLALDVVKLLVSSGADTRIRDDAGSTLLMLASGAGSAGIAQFLLSSGIGGDVNAEQYESGTTALIEATKNRHPSIVGMLLRAGADIDKGIRSARMRNRTPLMIAAEKGYFELVQLNINHGADVALRDDTGENAFSLAVKSGSRSVVETIMKHCMSLPDGKYSNTPLSALLPRRREVRFPDHRTIVSAIMPMYILKSRSDAEFAFRLTEDIGKILRESIIGSISAKQTKRQGAIGLTDAEVKLLVKLDAILAVIKAEREKDSMQEEFRI